MMQSAHSNCCQAAVRHFCSCCRIPRFERSLKRTHARTYSIQVVVFAAYPRDINNRNILIAGHYTRRKTDFWERKGSQRNELSVSKMLGARATFQCHTTSRQFTCLWLYRLIVRTYCRISSTFANSLGSYDWLIYCRRNWNFWVIDLTVWKRCLEFSYSPTTH